MSCKNWEERVALHAARDLAGADAAEVVRHLADCAGCREAAAAFAWTLEVAREVHAEPIAPAHYAAVRARVMGKLAEERRPVWRSFWAWGLAAAAVAALVVALSVGRTSRSAFRAGVSAPAATAPEVAVLQYGPAAPVLPVKRPIRKPVAMARPVVRQEGRPGGPPHSMTIKLLTDDPDVVIYWIADAEGE